MPSCGRTSSSSETILNRVPQLTRAVFRRAAACLAGVDRVFTIGGAQAVGTTMISSFTPATLAGIAFISTDDGYAALPPGTYSPTRSSGVTFWPSLVPSASTYDQDSARWRSWKLRTRAAAE